MTNRDHEFNDGAKAYGEVLPDDCHLALTQRFHATGHPSFHRPPSRNRQP